MNALFRRLQTLVRREQFDQDLREEMNLHLELRRRTDPAAAQHFGNLTSLHERSRDTWGMTFVLQLAQDLRYGLRTMLRTPGFTAVAVIALALGIGANTAIFSVVNAVLMRPLAYRDPERLVTILHNGNGPVGTANYFDWRDQSTFFESMAGADYWTADLTGMDRAETISGVRVTQNLMPMLGVPPLLGRLFLPGEDQKGAEHEVILSYRLWQRRFAGDRAVLGTSIRLNGQSYAIVGVMPPEFKFAPFWATRAELWAPDMLADEAHNRGGNHLRVFARLKPGATLSQARTEMAAITSRLEQQFPGTNRHVEVIPLKEKVVGKIETPLLVLMGAVGFVLLIACANVAHLLLARAAARQKEIAVRAALGAGRGRMIRQFLTESLLLASAGAAAGLLLAKIAINALVALKPADIPRIDTLSIDAKVAAFLFGVTLLTGVLFGLAPAWQVSPNGLAGALKESGRGTSDSLVRNRLRSFLVASEFALALVLLVGAGLMIRSFAALQSIDPGFDPHNVLSMVVSVAGSKEAPPERREIFYRELLERMRALPGVQSASAINHLPLAGDLWGWNFTVEGRPRPKPGESPIGVYRIVMPDYFRAMGLPIVRGRAISATDDRSAPGVVIINQRAAARYWPAEDPIGKRITFDDGKTWLSIIGVSKDAAEGDWAARTESEVYLAALQNRQFLGEPGSHASYLTLVIRTAGAPGSLAAAARDTVWSLDRDLPVSQVLTMDQVVSEANAQPRFEMLLLVVFAAIALVLAAVGIYGVMSYSVSRRAHELGIRISLGASRGNVLRLVIGHGMALAIAGCAAGAAGALFLTRLMTRLLYGVRPTDPLTFGGVALLLMLIALLATYIPARRATRIDPIAALRCE